MVSLFQKARELHEFPFTREATCCYDKKRSSRILGSADVDFSASNSTEKIWLSTPSLPLLREPLEYVTNPGL